MPLGVMRMSRGAERAQHRLGQMARQWKTSQGPNGPDKEQMDRACCSVGTGSKGARKSCGTEIKVGDGPAELRACK